MKFNSKITGALAWAGVIVVLAVPAADFLTGDGDTAGVVVPEVDVTRTASVPAPATDGASAAPDTVAATDDPVDAYISSGRKLPSYISDPPAGVAAEGPAPVVRLVVPDAPTAAVTQPPAAAQADPSDSQLAALPAEPAIVPPIPYPATMRPAPRPAAAMAATGGGVGPLIIDEDLVQRREAAVARVLEPDSQSSRVVSGSELEEWDSGSLAEYLRQRGLISEGGGGQDVGSYEAEPDRSRARVIRRLPPRDFFLF